MSIGGRLALVISVMVPVSVSAQTPIGQGRSQAALAGVRLACFSPQRAFAESAQGKVAMARLMALRDQKTREIDEKNLALHTQEQALLDSAALLNEAVRTQRTKELEGFRINVQRFIRDAQTELLGVQRDVESAFLVKLTPAVEQVAKESGLQLVFNLDEGSIAWADPALDITGEVVKQLARVEVPSSR